MECKQHHRGTPLRAARTAPPLRSTHIPVRSELLAVQSSPGGTRTMCAPAQCGCGSFPARSTPVRKAVTNCRHTDTHRGLDAPSQHLGIGKEHSSSGPQFHPSGGKFPPWVLAALLKGSSCWNEFLTVWLRIPGPPKAVDSLPYPHNENKC